MGTITDKSTFKQALEQYQSKNTTARELRFLDSFYFLNESQGLPPDLLRKKDIAIRKMFKNPDLKEKYYIFHLIRNIDTKWKSVNIKELTSNFYKTSKVIAEIWETL